MANGITLKVDSGPYIVTAGTDNVFYTDTGLTSEVAFPVTITSTTVWYVSAANAGRDYTLTVTQLDGTDISPGSIRVGQTTDTFLRPTPTAGQLGSDVSQPWSDMLDLGESTVPRFALSNQSTTTVTGRLMLGYFTARKTETVTKVGVAVSGTAAAATPTLVRMGVWTSNSAGDGLALVGSTANDTAWLASTNTYYTKSLSASFTKTAGQRYAVGLLVVSAGACPTIHAASNAGTALRSIHAEAPRTGFSYLGSQTDLPSSWAAASLSATDGVPYFELLTA